MTVNPSNREMKEMNKLYRSIVSSSHSVTRTGQNKKELEGKLVLVNSGIDQDKRIISMLLASNKQISEELEKGKQEYGNLKNSMKEVEELIAKLEKMDFIQTELVGLKRNNSAMRLKVTPLSAKIWKLQEELFHLRKEKERVQQEYTDIVAKSNELTGLRKKILPLGQLLDLRDRFKKESEVLEKHIKDVGIVKEELARIIPIRDDLKQELESTIERLSSAEKLIKSMDEKIKKIAPRVMPDDDEKQLEDDVRELKSKKDELNNEKKEISPRIAAIAEEEERLTTLLESYKAKSKKDKDKLASLKKDLKELKIDKDSVDRLKKEVTKAEMEHKSKKKAFDKLKSDYSGLLGKNQEYKKTIEEVEIETKKLKKMMKKKK